MPTQARKKSEVAKEIKKLEFSYAAKSRERRRKSRKLELRMPLQAQKKSGVAKEIKKLELSYADTGSEEE